MKKYLSFIIIAILFVACDSTNDLGMPFSKGQEVSLTAAIGEQRPQLLPEKQRVSGKDSGTEIHLTWDEGDKILIKVDDKSAEFTLSDGVGTGEGTFTGIMPADGTSFHVEYPINYSDDVLKEQTYVPNGFGKGLMKMSTKTAGTLNNGFTLSADNALLGLQLTGDGEIGKIVLSRNNAEGKAGYESYTLLCPNIMLTAEPTLFYIVVLPDTWENGFTVEVFDNDNSVVIDKFVKTSSITFGTDNAIIMPEKNVQNIVWYTSEAIKCKGQCSSYTTKAGFAYVHPEGREDTELNRYYQGKRINCIRLQVAKEGTFTVSVANRENLNEVFNSQKIELANPSQEVQTYYLPNTIDLQHNQVLVFAHQDDTGQFYFSKDIGNNTYCIMIGQDAQFSEMDNKTLLIDAGYCTRTETERASLI